MADRQNQKASEGATAIQATGDVNVGYGADDVAKIIDAVSRIIPGLAAEAERKAEAKFEEFKERLIEEIFEKGNGKADAFADPDFIYILKKGQESYGRTDSDFNHASLVDLVARRSQAETGTRKAHILNEAVEQAGKLSASEIGVLCLAFTTNHVASEGIFRVQNYVERFKWIEECVSSIDDIDSSIAYLQSLGLCTPISIPSSLYERIYNVYPILKKDPIKFESVIDFLKNTHGDHIFTTVMDNYRLISVDISSVEDVNELLVVPYARTEEDFVKRCATRGIPRQLAAEKFKSFKDMEDDPLEWLAGQSAAFARMKVLFESGLKGVALTSPAIAIAHAYLAGGHDFKASINIWIK